MTISFNLIPASLPIPGSYVEFDNSRALSGSPDVPNRMLLVGQRLTGQGSTLALIPTKIFAVDQAIAAFGRGSMLAQMVKAAIAASADTELWAVALDDLAAGSKASGTITVTGPAAAGGTLALMIGGVKTPVGVALGASAIDVAAAIVLAVNANPDLPVTAANALGVVTLTARHKGTAGNDIDLRANYYQGDVLPTGIALAIVDMSGGAGDPDVATVWSVIGDEYFPTMAFGFNNAATIAAVDTELTSRWGPLRQIEGHGYFVKRGNFAVADALGGTVNSLELTIMPVNRSPSNSWEIAASLAATCGTSLSIDPARPVWTLPLPGILAPAVQDRFTKAQQALLIADGLSTYVVDAGGLMTLQRVVTTYKTNSFGATDVSWQEINTPATAAAMRFGLRSLGSRYARYKLASDNTRFGAGQAITTPKLFKVAILGLARDWEDRGWLENYPQFAADLIVERSITDRGRLNILCRPDFVNQLRVQAIQIQFIL